MKLLTSKGKFITLVGPEKDIGKRKLSTMQFIGMLLYTFKRGIWSNIFGPKYILVSTPLAEMQNAISFMRKNKIEITIDRVIPFELEVIRTAVDHVYSRHTNGKTIIQLR